MNCIYKVVGYTSESAFGVTIALSSTHLVVGASTAKKVFVDNRRHLQLGESQDEVGSRTTCQKSNDFCNLKKNCWSPCGHKQGPCRQFCGRMGVCCRRNWPDNSRSCDGTVGGLGYHACSVVVQKKETAADHTLKSGITKDVNRRSEELQAIEDKLEKHNADRQKVKDAVGTSLHMEAEMMAAMLS